MNAKYLKYLLKTFTPVVIVYAVVCIFAYLIIPVSMVAFPYPTSIDYIKVCSFGIASLAGALVFPFILHNRYYSKNSSDIYLSLPMSRRQAFLTENVLGLWCLVLVTAVTYSLGAFSTAGFALLAEKFFASKMSDVFLILPLLLLAIVVVYLISMTGASLANNQREGIRLTLYFHAIPSLLYCVVLIIIYGNGNESIPHWLKFLFSSPSAYCSFISAYVNGGYDFGFGEIVVTLLINLALWIVISFFALQEFRKHKSEHFGTAEMERFGEKNVFPVFAFLCYIYLGILLGCIFRFDDLGFVIFKSVFLIAYVLLLCGSIIVYWIMVITMRKKVGCLTEDVFRFAIAIVPSQIIGVVICFLCIN